MKIAFCADLHVWNHKVHGSDFNAGLNNRCRMVLDVLKRGASAAVAVGCREFVVCGDVFDGVKPSPQMVAALQEVIEESEMEWHLLVGNHDSASSAPGDHALAPLLPVANVYEIPQVVELMGLDLVVVPYQAGIASEWFPEAVRSLTRRPLREERILCFHLGVEDSKTARSLSGSHDSVTVDMLRPLMLDHEITASFAGNWHDHRVWRDPLIVQCGTLCPTGYNNPGADEYGRVCVYDTQAEDVESALSVIEIPGPRFLKINAEDRDYIAATKLEGNTVYVKWTAQPDEFSDAEEVLGQWKQDGLVSEGGVYSDVDASDELARNAAQAAKSAETFDEALSGFVKNMDLKDLDPDDVLSRCREFLKTEGENATRIGLSVREAVVENFMRYDEATFEFPETGIVLVSGENGQGKSTIVESVVAGCWNKTLRKTPWWRMSSPASVRLTLSSPDLVLTRNRTRGGSLKFEIEGAAEFDTSKKAQDYVKEHIPDLKLWRKTSVFTSANLEGLNFTGLGDGGQKRLIEEMVGVSRFEPALKLCREKLSETNNEITELKHKLEVVDVRMESAKERQESALEDRESLVLPDAPEERRSEYQDGSDAASKDKNLLTQRKHRLERSLMQKESDIRQLERDLKRVDRSNCPECGAPIPKEHARRLREEIEESRAELGELRQFTNSEIAVLDGQLDETSDEIEWCRRKFAEATADASRYADFKARKSKVEADIRDATMSITKLSSERASLVVSLREAEESRSLLQACERVLGLRGVRAHLVAQTLHGIQSIANRWLREMGDLQIELREDRLGSEGQVIEELNLVVHGAGGGFGYNACSAGERRRVDVAILLALAKISQAAHGMGDGTLFFDEVFDVLDHPGTVGVASALSELAESRCVVVISHSERVQKVLEAAVHYHVEDGRVSEVS